jgi:hypothetical protein
MFSQLAIYFSLNAGTSRITRYLGILYVKGCSSCQVLIFRPVYEGGCLKNTSLYMNWCLFKISFQERKVFFAQNAERYIVAKFEMNKFLFSVCSKRGFVQNYKKGNSPLLHAYMYMYICMYICICICICICIYVYMYMNWTTYVCIVSEFIYGSFCLSSFCSLNLDSDLV